MEAKEKSLREKLESEIGPADWKVLRPHYTRGAIIIVSQDLNLIDVALKIAENNTAEVEGWINGGKLTRPGPEDAKRWEEEAVEPSALVVSPYVLVQEGKERG